ncbi:NAD-P-binding protein [Epithele typhae]|uniref:NAD-P-binding protein n=1 Tax=Epithele typhae TaxID=378194 RepID=UPI0020082476|nr:NAD-P-binding protein [Epithele typhae]KAH9944091.1 NAD-P-binding protein [Epithele typhae]
MPGIKDAKCILVIGATAGLGRALALALHDLESKPTVIAVGRRHERLDELAQTRDRIKTFRADMNVDEQGIRAFVQSVLSSYPDVDAILFVSGVQHLLDFKKPENIDLKAFDDELNINYLALTKTFMLFLPHLLKLSEEGRCSFLVPVTSSLAIVPGAPVPGYSATKAAVRSFTQSLRVQLDDTKIKVMEIVPPLVESELHDHQGTTPALSKFSMPLADLVRGDDDIAVGNAELVRQKFEVGKYEAAAKLYHSSLGSAAKD